MDEARGTFREEKCCIKPLIRLNCWKTCPLGGHGLPQDRNIFFESRVKAVAARQPGCYLGCVEAKVSSQTLISCPRPSKSEEKKFSDVE